MVAVVAGEDGSANVAEKDYEMEREDGADPTPWIRLDPAAPDAAVRMHPPFARVAHRVMRVRLAPHECLYLPTGWYHRVTQSRATIAVNYWYDREFNAPWVLQRAVEAFVGLALRVSPAMAASDAASLRGRGGGGGGGDGDGGDDDDDDDDVDADQDE